MAKTKADILAERRRNRDLTHGETDAKAVEATAEEAKPEVDLDDPVTQERIINPDGSVVELSYGSITLYTPSVMVRRLAYAFCQEILADAAETRPSTAQVFSMRVISKLMESAAPQLRLFRLIASMCGRPGSIDDKTAMELSTEIAENASPDDVAILFERLSVGAGLGKAPSAKK